MFAIDSGYKVPGCYNIEDHLPVIIATGFAAANERIKVAIEKPDAQSLEEALKYIETPLNQLLNFDSGLKAN